MRYFPIELDVNGRPVALLGGSSALVPKVDRLLAAGAEVTLYRCGAPLAPELGSVVEMAGVQVEPGEPSETALESVVAVIASPDLEQLERWKLWARRCARPFCALDKPELSTFVNPAAGEVNGIAVRVFSAGVSPGLSRRVRDSLLDVLGDARFAVFVAKLAELRATLPPGQRSERMRHAIDGFALEARIRYPKWFGG
jgi:precorrin-2 dehydrogenase / sirohydrochlorin ferrochelatase